MKASPLNSGKFRPVGENKLRIISVGTGSFREKLNTKRAAMLPAVGLAVKALAGMISDAQNQMLTMMQLLGKTSTNWTINSETGNLADVQLLPEPLFEFTRYDVRLETDWLRETLDLDLPEKDIERVRQMDNPDMIGLAYDIGVAAAVRMVKTEHFELAAV